ncbi:hypothetical protein OF83DRAFT_1079949 [Amylostereum chailletii]|nr:hypothetical protein OF83DRAFT_1079949 [Amylostereum chailletii]
MPVAPVNDHGTEFYYEDSGPLKNNTYTTLIIVHGTGIHGAIFRPMLPFARSNNLRIVLLNRRDYPGSTPLSEEELRLAKPGRSVDDNAAYLRSRALEIAEFIAWFIRTQSIPRSNVLDNGGEAGGLAVVGWSSANAFLLALFGNPDTIPATTRMAIEPYLRSYIFYGRVDGPLWAVGLPFPELPDNPTFIPPLASYSLSVDERLARFKTWVSAYYQHPSVSSREISGLTTVIPDNPIAPPTLDRMTPDEQNATTSKYGLFHSDNVSRRFPLEVFERNRNRALFWETENQALWKKVPVLVLQCEHSLLEVVSTMWALEDELIRHIKAGKPTRAMEFYLLEGANHFAQWDCPDRLTRRFAELLRSSHRRDAHLSSKL